MDSDRRRHLRLSNRISRLYLSGGVGTEQADRLCAELDKTKIVQRIKDEAADQAAELLGISRAKLDEILGS